MLALAALGAVSGAWAEPDRAERATVAVATNFARPMARIEASFEAAEPHELIIVTGSTGQLYAQIVNGAPYDVFLAADAERPRLLGEDRLGGVPRTYALGRLALWTRAPEYQERRTLDVPARDGLPDNRPASDVPAEGELPDDGLTLDVRTGETPPDDALTLDMLAGEMPPGRGPALDALASEMPPGRGPALDVLAGEMPPGRGPALDALAGEMPPGRGPALDALASEIPPDDGLTLDVLAGDGFRRLAIANPRLAPYGAAAMETLQTLGLRDRLRPRIVLGENVGQAFAMAETRNAELGLVALSAALAYTGGAAHVPVPTDYHEPIRQDAILLARGRDNAAAQALLRFLESSEARRIIAASGYGLPQARQPETERPEMDSPETVLTQAGMPEAELPEAEPSEAESPEAGLPETELTEAELPEAGLPEAGLTEAGLTEARLTEAESPEAGLPETALP